MLILFACLSGWLDASPVEIKTKLRHGHPAWAGVNTGIAPCMALVSTITIGSTHVWHQLILCVKIQELDVMKIYAVSKFFEQDWILLWREKEKGR